VSPGILKNRFKNQIGDSDTYNELQMRQSATEREDRIAAPTDGLSRGALRVLVVDAYRASADTTSMLVGRWGHDVRRAYDGNVGLALAAEFQPDVVFMEIFMPGMSGLDLARQMRRQISTKDCLLVAVTGRADDHRRELCSDAGINLVLIKPVDPPILETLLMLESDYLQSRNDTAPFSVMAKAFHLTNETLRESLRGPNTDLLGGPNLIGGFDAC
jgi:CheY-like chemotaxis protein